MENIKHYDETHDTPQDSTDSTQVAPPIDPVTGRRTGLAALSVEMEDLDGRPASVPQLKSSAAPGAPSNSFEVGTRLRAARNAAGITGRELGAAIGLAKDQVSKIESGKRSLSVAELAKAAAFLQVSAPSLLGAAETARPVLAVAARLAPGAGSDSTRAQRRRARQLLELDDLLSQMAQMPTSHPSPGGERVLEHAKAQYATIPRNQEAQRRQGKELAQTVPSELDLGSDALGDLAGLMELHFAVDVALSPFGNADGLCVHSGDTALILANTEFSIGHVRFTLAHELAHHVFGDPREVIAESESDMFANSAVERRANAFAGHLLMPEAGLTSVLQWYGESPQPKPDPSGGFNGRVIGERSLVGLMTHFGVSVNALLVQLDQLGWLGWAEGTAMLRGSDGNRSVGSLFAEHPDVSGLGAGLGAALPNEVRPIRRPPERLMRHAMLAAQEQKVGLGVVASLLEVEDDEELWARVMGDLDSSPIDDDFDL